MMQEHPQQEHPRLVVRACTDDGKDLEG